MGKRGFTLVELLAVLVVLSLIALIIIPSVSGTVTKSRESAYEKQIQVVETASEKWGLEHLDKLPDINSNDIVAIDFNTLYTSGQLTDYPVFNPKTQQELEGCILISYSAQYSQYEYKYTSDQSKCDLYNVNK